MAVDSAGRAISDSFSVTLEFHDTAGGATLSGTLTQKAVNGIATFPDLSISAPGGGYTLGGSANGLSSATSAAFNITARLATRLAFTVQPQTTVAGATPAPAVTVAAEDDSGNVVNGYTGEIATALAPNEGGAQLSGWLAVGAAGGIATFSHLQIYQVGTGYKLVASASGLATATSTTFNVTGTQGQAALLAFVVPPLPVAAGTLSTSPVQVVALTQNGFTATNFTDPITMSVVADEGNSTTLSAATVAATNGIAAFTDLPAPAYAAVLYTLCAAAPGFTSVCVPWSVTGATPRRVVFIDQPYSFTLGQQQGIWGMRVALVDSAGNWIAWYSAQVTLRLGANPGGATLSGDLSEGTYVGPGSGAVTTGVAMFRSVLLDKPGTGYTLVASAGGGLASDTSRPFDVLAPPPPPPPVATFYTQPTTPQAGATIVPAVRVAAVDPADGFTASSYTGAISIALAANPTGGTLAGTLTVNAVNGVATFPDLSITRAGSGYVLGATGSGLAGNSSNTFSVVPAAPTDLVFATEPSTTSAGGVITPGLQVAVFDRFGNLVPSFTGPVTIALEANAGGGTLTGTLVANAVGGIVTFSDLRVTAPGASYTLHAASSGLASATSATFDVTP